MLLAIVGALAALVGLAILALAGMIVFGTAKAPPPLASVYDAVAGMDL